jgi:hypothetical protein
MNVGLAEPVFKVFWSLVVFENMGIRFHMRLNTRQFRYADYFYDSKIESLDSRRATVAASLSLIIVTYACFAMGLCSVD